MELNSLILAERDRAYRLAQRITGDADLAADVLQETCLSVLAAARSGGASEPRTRSWFLKAVVNTARDMQKGGQRRRRREERWSVGREPVGAETPSQTNIRAELVREVARAMRELEPQYRLPLALCYEEGLTHAEAAEVLGLERSSVGFHVQRALDRLRERLGERGIKAAPAVIIGLLEAFRRLAPPPRGGGGGRANPGRRRGRGWAGGDRPVARLEAGGGAGDRAGAGSACRPGGRRPPEASGDQGAGKGGDSGDSEVGGARYLLDACAWPGRHDLRDFLRPSPPLSQGRWMERRPRAHTRHQDALQ